MGIADDSWNSNTITLQGMMHFAALGYFTMKSNTVALSLECVTQLQTRVYQTKNVKCVKHLVSALVYTLQLPSASLIIMLKGRTEISFKSNYYFFYLT